MEPLLHMVVATEWAARTDRYVPAAFAREGFVHCSFAHQLLGVANHNPLFRGRTDLLLLVIDPAALDAEVVVEDLYGEGRAYPHIYGTVPVDAVTAVLDFQPGPDGRFALPEAASPST